SLGFTTPPGIFGWTLYIRKNSKYLVVLWVQTQAANSACGRNLSHMWVLPSHIFNNIFLRILFRHLHLLFVLGWNAIVHRYQTFKMKFATVAASECS
ncbi:hypothetical protein DL89DRAFT_307765, partial [Linderina pennispora]